jgi:Protein of unknown function (DUF4244)
MLRVLVHIQIALSRSSFGHPAPHLQSARSGPDDAGQTTAEYALVLLGAAAVALLVVTWATKTDAIGKLFDFVLGHVIGSVK